MEAVLPRWCGGGARGTGGCPSVFAIDANEPVAETADSVTFGWAEGRAGARKLGALLESRPSIAAAIYFANN